MRQPFFLLWIVFLSCHVARGQYSLLEPTFNHLSEPDLLALQKKAQTPLDQGLVEFFLSERLFLLGKIHESRSQLTGVEKRCEFWRVEKGESLSAPEKARAGYLCLYTYSQLGQEDLANFSFFLGWLNESQLSKEENWLAEGRLSVELPHDDRNFAKRGLLSLNFLRSLRPEISQVDYWIARAHARAGRAGAFRDFLQSGIDHKPPDFRALEVNPYRRSQDLNDGLGWGIGPQLFASTSQALGLGLYAFDDRAFDRPLAVKANLYGTSRGSVGGALSVRDESLLYPLAALISVSAEKLKEPFYGFSMDSRLDDLTLLDRSAWEVRVGLSQPVIDSVALNIGWQFQHQEITGRGEGGSRNVVLPGAQKLLLSAPTGNLTLDTRDSRLDPQGGYFAQVGGIFPSRFSGSDLNSKIWQVSAESYWGLGYRRVISAFLSWEKLEGEKDFLLFRSLGYQAPVAAIAPLRFRGEETGLLGVNVRPLVFEKLALSAYGVMGAVGQKTSDLWSGKKGGAGLTLERLHPLHRGSLGKITVGFFGSEFNFQVGAAVGW